MVSKVRVYGKAQNRTALGIINAYQVMYPHATLEDLKKAFPDELNPDSGSKIILMTMEEVQKNVDEGNEWYVKGQGYFVDEDDLLTMPDKQKVAVVRMWTKESLDRLVNHAKQYGIEIAEFEKGMKGQKGGFRLEYLNGYVPPVAEKKKTPAWLWALLALGIIAIAALAFLLGNSGKKTETIVEEKTVIVHDTVYMEKIEELETKFNAAQFSQGKAELNDETKFVLHDLAKLMEKNPDVKLKIEGHTSAEGDAATNQKLSEERAKITVDFLISQGVSEDRLSYEGLGSSKLKNEADPNAEENRRTEFIVIK